MTRYRVMVAKRVPTHRFLKPIVGSNGKSPVVEAKSKQDARAKVRKRCGHKFVVGKAYPVSSQLEGLTVKRFRLPPWLDLIIMPLAFAVIVGALILTLVTVTGCDTKTRGGDVFAREFERATTEAKDGTRETTERFSESSAKQPENAEDGASAGAGEAVSTIKGGSQVSDGAAETRAHTLTLLGALCILIGVGTFVLRFTSLPFAGVIPWTASAAMIGVGALLLSWHLIAGPVAVIAVVGVVGFVVYFLYHNGFLANLRKPGSDAGKPSPPGN